LPKRVHGPENVRHFLLDPTANEKRKAFGIQWFITIARLWCALHGVAPKYSVIADSK